MTQSGCTCMMFDGSGDNRDMRVETFPYRVYHELPRRVRRRRRSVWRRTVWPLLKLCAAAALAFVLINAAFSWMARPIGLLNHEYRETRHIAAQLAALRKENIALERRIKYLESPQGAEQAARKLGYVKPGEITLVMPE